MKLQVSFAKEPYKRDNILQKRPIILRSLLIVATPYSIRCVKWSHYMCGMTHSYEYMTPPYVTNTHTHTHTQTQTQTQTHTHKGSPQKGGRTVNKSDALTLAKRNQPTHIRTYAGSPKKGGSAVNKSDALALAKRNRKRYQDLIQSNLVKLTQVAVCCGVLRCGVACCGVLRCVAGCCSVVRCGAVWCSVLQCVAVCCSVVQCVTMCCTVLHCVALCCTARRYWSF